MECLLHIRPNKPVKAILIILAIALSATVSTAQLLSKPISLNIKNQRLDNVLEIISNKGDFYFSYNSSIINKDSLVNLSISNRSVKEVLSLLFNNTYEFKESGNFIIIKKAPIRMTMVTKVEEKEDRIFTISGFVYNENNGLAIRDASVYEKKLLVAALTNHEGYFKLRFKSSKASAIELYVSKEFYADTMIKLSPRHTQEVTITMIPSTDAEENTTVTPLDYLIPDSLQATKIIPTDSLSYADLGKVERTGMGKFLLTSGQKIQSLNLKKFFTERPFQVSLIPGLSSHGKLSSQVINKFSLNVLGGYTAGTQGIELGGIFNIDKKDVHFFQGAGVFNIVGGEVRGMQLAGVHNTNLGSTFGFQAAGVSNYVRGAFKGFQVGGVYNHVNDSVRGWQAAGVGNYARNTVKGVQIGGVFNFSNRSMNGVQIAGVINYAKRLKGVQFGLINIVDSSDGYSIGLINIVLNGYHKLSITANDMTDVNAAFKTGNSKFYSILQAGMRSDDKNKLFAFGYGLGSDLPFNKKKTLFFNPEVISQYLYAGSWDNINLLNRAQLNLNIKINKFISIYGGPALNVLFSKQTTGVAGYKYPIIPTYARTYDFGPFVNGWLGWNVGVNFF